LLPLFASPVVLHRSLGLLCCGTAGWQSGHAADCKSVYAGSIPTPASTFTVFSSRFISVLVPGMQIATVGIVPPA